jgi:hypothetical protein
MRKPRRVFIKQLARISALRADGRGWLRLIQASH